MRARGRVRVRDIVREREIGKEGGVERKRGGDMKGKKMTSRRDWTAPFFPLNLSLSLNFFPPSSSSSSSVCFFK